MSSIIPVLQSPQSSAAPRLLTQLWKPSPSVKPLIERLGGLLYRALLANLEVKSSSNQQDQATTMSMFPLYNAGSIWEMMQNCARVKSGPNQERAACEEDHRFS